MKMIRSFLAIKLDLATVENLAETQKAARAILEHARDYAIFLPDREGFVRSCQSAGMEGR